MRKVNRKKSLYYVFVAILVLLGFITILAYFGKYYQYGTELNLEFISFILNVILFAGGVIGFPLAYLELRRELREASIKSKLSLHFYDPGTKQKNDRWIAADGVKKDYKGKMRWKVDVLLYVYNNGTAPAHDYRVLLWSNDESVITQEANGWRGNRGEKGIQWFKYNRVSDFNTVYPKQLIRIPDLEVYFENGMFGEYQFEYKIQSVGSGGVTTGRLTIVIE